MKNKIKVTLEVANSIEHTKNFLTINEVLETHCNIKNDLLGGSKWIGESRPLNNLTTEQLATALLVGYEVEYSPEESIKLAYDYHKEISSDKNTHDFRKHLRADAFCEGMEYVLKELNKEIEDIKYSPIIKTIKKAAIYKASKGDSSYE